jgi:hypothetical protein
MRRRQLLQAPLGALAARQAVAAPEESAGKPASRMRCRTGREIAASPLSVGMETLDREQFDPARTYSHVGRLGVKWARLQTGWARTERVRGEYDFRWLDAVVDTLRGLGVQPWLSLSYGNRLYTPEAQHETAVGFVPLTPSAREGWVRYVRAAAAHFRGRVTHWEIWNEPNGKGFWRPAAPDPAGYAELAGITAAAVRQAIPDATLIGGALAGLGDTLDYLEKALEAGLGRHVQCISYHPYRQLPEANYASEVGALRGLLARYGRFRIWQGENGVRSVKSDIPGRNWVENESQQARWLLRRILLDLSMGVELTSYFHMVDLMNYNWGAGPSSEAQHMGLLRGADYSPKPAYFAYQCLCSLFDAETAPADLMVSLPAPGAQVVSFARRGYALCGYWSPTSLLAPPPPQRSAVKIWTGAAVRLEKPVLIDPLTAAVTPLEKARHYGSYWLFGSLPLTDSPLLIADAALVEA